MSEACEKCGADISFQGEDHANCDEVVRLRAVLSGDAGVLQMHADRTGMDIGLEHPLIAVMADSLAKMVDGHNYVEMRMKHKPTGDEYTIHIQRLSRPTPHELRKRAEEEVERWKKWAEYARQRFTEETGKDLQAEAA
jgi:hypothetical protein